MDTETAERVPLGEVSTNSPNRAIDAEITEAKPKALKRSKSKSKKGGRGKKAKAVEEEQFDDAVVLEDERQAAGSPASDAAADELATPPANGACSDSNAVVRQLICDADVFQIPMHDEVSAKTPSRAVRLTRRQLAMQEEALSKSQCLPTPPSYSEPTVAEVVAVAVQSPKQEKEKESIAPETKDVAAVEVEEVQVTFPEADEVNPEHEEVEVSIQTKVDGTFDIREAEHSLPEAEEAKSELQEAQTTVSETNEAPIPEVTIPQVEVAEVQAPEMDIPDTQATHTEPDQPTTSETFNATEVEPKTLASENPHEPKKSTPTPSRTPSRSPSKSPAKSPSEAMEAIDALEEALENVIPSFNPANDQSPTKAKSKPATALKTGSTAPRFLLAASKASRNSTTPRPPVAASKVSTNPTAPKSMKPTTSRPSVVRSSSVRAPVKEARKGSGEVTDYLASKRRPISISFPTPPPPPKGTKPPTKSNFQLPGEAVAAKLKAAKEERLKREQEDGVQRPVSASATRAVAPVVKSSKPPTKPSFQLPGEAVAAKLKAQKEERQKREAQGLAVRPASVSASHVAPVVKSSKPPTKPSFQLPGEAVAAKLKAQREERMKAEKEEEEKKEREKTAFKARPVPRKSSAPVTVRQTSASRARESLMTGGGLTKENGAPGATSLAAKRMSSAPTAAAAKRVSVAPSTVTNPKRMSTIAPKAPIDAAAQRVKGREVYNRDKKEKEALDLERREKEEAAKKARAEAAERGRIASREWAERQKRKLMEKQAVKAETA
jgi:hypothetical protein